MIPPRVLTALVVLALSSTLPADGTIEGVVKFTQKGGSEGRLKLRYAGQTGSKKQGDKPQPSPAVVFLEDVPGCWPAPAEHPRMLQKDLAFVPRVLPVLVGTTVDFPNEDTLQHNVFSYSAVKRFDLGRYRTGESRPVTFDQPGLVRVYCEIHSHMKGFVLVLKNPYFALVAEDGSFRIDGVPAGTYKLTAWQEEHDADSVEVKVEEGRPTNSELNLATSHQPVRPTPTMATSPCCDSNDGGLDPPAMEIEPLPGTDRGGDSCDR